MNPRIENWLSTAKTRYTTNHPLDTNAGARFERLANLMRNWPGLVNLLNSAVTSGSLQGMIYGSASVTGRSAYGSDSRTPIKHHGSLQVLRVNENAKHEPVISNGKIQLGDDLFAILAGTGNFSTLTPDQ
ncbi:MAG: hypothetical protein ABIW83_01030, partial [Allosphingosinicella sp.]